MLAAGWGVYTPPAPSFTEVPATHAFCQYIETAYSHNIISDYSCGTGCLEFRPGNNATRGQICKIMYLAISGSKQPHVGVDNYTQNGGILQAQ
jgi:hypothetical protein